MVTNQQIAQSFSNENLELIILPTEKCNFRCTYCYEDFSIGKMKEPIIRATEYLLQNRLKSLKSLSISWFGGEPLLALDIVLRINNFINNEISKNNYEIDFKSSMTTNGYFLNLENAIKLFEANVKSYQISLDGDKDFHNKTRIKANGTGTFDRIWNNLIQIRESEMDIEILLRLHINEDNYESCFDFIKKLKSELLFDSRFKLLIKAIGKYGGKNDHLINPLSKEEEQELANYIFEHKVQDENQNICYASKPNSFVIRADGNINKCTVALNNPINNIGKLVGSGSMEINTDLAKLWSLGFFNNDKDYLECPMSKIPELVKKADSQQAFGSMAGSVVN